MTVGQAIPLVLYGRGHLQSCNVLLAGTHSTWRTLKRGSISLCASSHRGKYKGCEAWQATADLEETNLLLKIPLTATSFSPYLATFLSSVTQHVPQ